MVCKEMMEHTDNGVGALPHVNSLVDQVVHLSWEGLTTHTEHGTLSRCQEVHGAGLEDRLGKTPAVPCQNCSGQR